MVPLKTNRKKKSRLVCSIAPKNPEPNWSRTRAYLVKRGTRLTSVFSLIWSRNTNRFDFCLQESDSGGDSGYPSERRSEGDPNDHVDGVKISF